MEPLKLYALDVGDIYVDPREITSVSPSSHSSGRCSVILHGGVVWQIGESSTSVTDKWKAGLDPKDFQGQIDIINQRLGNQEDLLDAALKKLRELGAK